MYGYKCEYCDGLVGERVVEREVLKHKDGFVVLENVPVGVCNKCGHRYYHASLLHESERMKPAAASFRQGWQEAMRGQTRPISELWE